MDKLPQTDNPFELLGVAEDGDQRDLKRAYTRLIKVHRPDRDAEAFKRVRQAYETALSYLNDPWYQPESNTAEDVSQGRDGGILVAFHGATEAEPQQEETREEELEEAPLLEPEIQTEIPEPFDYPDIEGQVMPDKNTLSHQAEAPPIESLIPEKDPDSPRTPPQDYPDSLALELDRNPLPDLKTPHERPPDMGGFQLSLPDLQSEGLGQVGDDPPSERPEQTADTIEFTGDWELFRQKLQSEMEKGGKQAELYESAMETVVQVADPFAFLVLTWDLGLRNGADLMAFSERVDDTLLDALWKRSTLTWPILRRQADPIFAGALYREGLERNVIHQRQDQSLRDLMETPFQVDVGAHPELEPLLYRVLLLLCWHAPDQVKQVFQRFPPHPSDGQSILFWLESALLLADHWRPIEDQALISTNLGLFLKYGVLNTETGKRFIKKTIGELLADPQALSENLEILNKQSPQLVEHLEKMAAHWKANSQAADPNNPVEDIWKLTHLQEINARIKHHPFNRFRILFILVPCIFLLISFIEAGVWGFAYFGLMLVYFRKFPTWAAKGIYRKVFRPFILERFLTDGIDPEDLCLLIANRGDEIGTEIEEYGDALAEDPLLTTLSAMYQMEFQAEENFLSSELSANIPLPEIESENPFDDPGQAKDLVPPEAAKLKTSLAAFQWEDLLAINAPGPGFKRLMAFCLDPRSGGRSVLIQACEELEAEPQTWVVALDKIKRKRPLLFKRLERLISLWAPAPENAKNTAKTLRSNPREKQINFLMYDWHQILVSKAFSHSTIGGFLIVGAIAIHMWIDQYWIHLSVLGASGLSLLGGYFAYKRWNYRKIIRPSFIGILVSRGITPDRIADFAGKNRTVFPKLFAYVSLLRKDKVSHILAALYWLRFKLDAFFRLKFYAWLASGAF